MMPGAPYRSSCWLNLFRTALEMRAADFPEDCSEAQSREDSVPLLSLSIEIPPVTSPTGKVIFISWSQCCIRSSSKAKTMHVTADAKNVDVRRWERYTHLSPFTLGLLPQTHPLHHSKTFSLLDCVRQSPGSNHPCL